MTNEDFERRMEFIIQQQAQFASDIQQLQEGMRQLRETQAQTERSIARTEQVVAQLADVTRESLTTTLEGFRDVNVRIEALTEAQTDTNAKLDTLVNSQIRLTEAQSSTEQSLRNLSETVDRYLREGRNGGSQSSS